MTERIAMRREEIMDACKNLYATMTFTDINLKEISKITSFSRPTIYNYFATKEEIFLAVLAREYANWTLAMQKIIAEHDTLSKENFAKLIAESIAVQPLMLKLLSLNLSDLEDKTRYEHVVAFKKCYGSTLVTMQQALTKFIPEYTEQDKQKVIYAFFPFLYGVHAYTVVTDIQKRSMQEVGIAYVYQSPYELVYSCLLRLLK